MKKLMLFIASVVLCGTMHAQNYHYSYNFHDYENSTPFIGEVYLDGVALTSLDFEIAAFVGNNVRSTEFLFEADPSSYPGRYYAWLGISYNNAGETVTFRLFDHATNTEYTNCSTTWVLDANGIGETWDPFIINFSSVNYGPSYPWVVSGSYENFMYIEAQIQINGVPVTYTNWEVGAFCSDVCRGLGDADNWWVSPIDQSNILEIVVGGATGDVINFCLYDVTNAEVFHGFCFSTLDWVDGDIGDMFDPYIINFVTEQTFTKDIVGYSDSDDHYYLIASPIGDVNSNSVTNMLSNNYDLYYFDQSQAQEWINYEGSDGNFNLVSGKGYLYANSADVTLSFTGYPYSGDGKVTMEKASAASFAGWNLVGNPFAQPAYIGTRAFYKMNAEGTNIESAIIGSAIEAMEGIFVIAADDNEVLTFSTTPPAKGAALVMNVTQNRGVSIDRAIVRFDEGDQLPKYMLNGNNTNLYIPQDNQDYAVVTAASRVSSMPVNFKAAKNGTYTINFSLEEVSFSYLHLIDNKTGMDIDLLTNPSYSFDALQSDYASRFRLEFKAQDESDDSFAFISNGQIILNGIDGDATIQVIDALGRIIISRDAQRASTISTNEMTAGVYILRLIEGNGTRTQKIVVK